MIPLLIALATALQAATLPHAAVCRVSNQVGNCKSIGSGTLVRRDDTSGTVITAKHIFSDGLGTVVVVFPRHSYTGKLIAVSRQWDLAAVRIARPDAAPATLAATWPRAGETVHWTGYGPGGKYAGGTGKATGYVRVSGSDGSETLQLTGHARNGDSGGPVFDNRGRLVAVLWGTDGRTICGTYGGRIHKFLQACCPGGVCPPRRRPMIPVAPVAEAPKPPPFPIPPGPRPDADEAPPFKPPAVTIAPPTVKPPPRPASGDLAAIRKEIAGLRAAIAELKTVAGPQGEPGEPGPRGPAGTVNLDKITAAVLSRLPPLYVRKINTATGEETVEEVRLGEGLTFTMTPHGHDDTGAN